jgi:hypothetical protein
VRFRSSGRGLAVWRPVSNCLENSAIGRERYNSVLPSLTKEVQVC